MVTGGAAVVSATASRRPGLASTNVAVADHDDVMGDQWGRALRLNLCASFTGAREAARCMIGAKRPDVIAPVAAFSVGAATLPTTCPASTASPA